LENYRNELMQDKNFIRCSVLIAELLLKYKTTEIEDTEGNGEPNGSPPPEFTYRNLIISVSSLITGMSKKLLLTENEILKSIIFIGAHLYLSPRIAARVVLPIHSRYTQE